MRITVALIVGIGIGALLISIFTQTSQTESQEIMAYEYAWLIFDYSTKFITEAPESQQEIASLIEEVKYVANGPLWIGLISDYEWEYVDSFNINDNTTLLFRRPARNAQFRSQLMETIAAPSIFQPPTQPTIEPTLTLESNIEVINTATPNP